MSLLTVLCICFVLLFILTIVSCVCAIRQAQRNSDFDAHEALLKTYDAGMDSNSLSKVEDHIYTLEANRIYAESIGKQRLASAIQNDISRLKQHADELALDKWDDRANGILSSFYDQYSFVVTADQCAFSQLEDVMAAKRKCLRLINQYWDLYHSQNPPVNPCQYMKDTLGSSFHPCMLRNSELTAKLDEHINRIRPEYKRKMQIYQDILTAIGNQSVQRSKLLNSQFQNAEKKEVECCYRKLVRDGRIVEVMLGNRWFSSLSDKEKIKRNNKQ